MQKLHKLKSHSGPTRTGATKSEGKTCTPKPPNTAKAIADKAGVDRP